MNSLSFYLSEKVFISSSLLKDSFIGYRILGRWFYLFQNNIFHSTLFFQGGFWWDVCCSSHLYFSIGKVVPAPLPQLLSRFSLSLWFSKLEYDIFKILLVFVLYSAFKIGRFTLKGGLSLNGKRSCDSK